MKISKYLSVVIFVGAIWSLLDVYSPAQGFNLKLRMTNLTPTKLTPKHLSTLAQSVEANSGNPDINRDLSVKDISVTRDSSDKSLLNVKGSIDNHGDRTHYVYYIVAKFISKDTSIKQAIIPINSKIEAGKSAEFNHEISTGSTESIAPETVKPVVVKYEYR